jgi:hypothetical protein
MIRDSPQGELRAATLAVRVHPRAKKTAITGVYGEGREAALKISLSSPAIEGRANHALVELLAAIFDVPRASVTILSGAQSRNKVVRIAGRSAAELTTLLASASGPPVH